MLATTFDTIRSVLKGDTSLSSADRARILELIRNDARPSKIATTGPAPVRLVRRAEAARRLGCSLRLVDRLAQDGVLQKRKLPGRVRAAGFLEADLDALIAREEATTAQNLSDNCQTTTHPCGQTDPETGQHPLCDHR